MVPLKSREEQVTIPISVKKIDRLRKIIALMENFKPCYPLSEVEEILMATVNYRNLLVQLQHLAMPLLSETDADRLSRIGVDHGNIYSLLEARDEVDALLPDIMEVIDTQEMQNEKQVATLLCHLRQRKEFYSAYENLERALDHADLRPDLAVTEVSCMIETICKIHLEKHRIQLPKKQTITSLWRAVSNNLNWDPSSRVDENVKQALSGLISIVSGVGALRTHAGLAHGHGRMRYTLEPRHAWLVINASSAVLIFLIETINQKMTEFEVSSSE